MVNVLVIDDWAERYGNELERRFPDVRFMFATSEAAVRAHLADCAPDILYSRRDGDIPDTAHRLPLDSPTLEWVQVGGSGYDHLLPLEGHDFRLTNCAGLLARHLAETVTGAMVALNGHFFTYRDQQRAAEWRLIPFRPLSEQTLLIVGLGAIGSWVAHNARALGMRVLATRRRQIPDENVDALHPPEALMQLLGEADFVSLHLRLNDQTHHMIGREALARMKPGAFLINTARGGVVDTDALIAALDAGELAGAYLDVFEQEPLPPASPLWARDDVFVTPHTSDNIIDYPVEMARVFADNLERWLKGDELERVVDY